jgi:uncharacterized OsmC-like protein
MAKKSFDVIFDAEGTNTSKFRNDVSVHMRGAAPRTDFLPTDEGPYHGGDGTAPYPLAYFTSGLTACIMTQLRAFSKRLNIDVTDFSVNCRCQWQAEQEGVEPYKSRGVAFTMDIDVGDRASLEDKKRLMAAAEQGCFIEVCLQPGLVKHRIKHQGEWIDV